MNLTNIRPFLAALPAACAAARFRLIVAPGGGDGGDAVWVDAVEDDFADAGEQPGGSGPGALTQVASATVRLGAVFDAANIDAARERQADLMTVARTALDSTRRCRATGGTLGVDRGSAPRYSTALTVEIYAR